MRAGTILWKRRLLQFFANLISRSCLLVITIQTWSADTDACMLKQFMLRYNWYGYKLDLDANWSKFSDMCPIMVKCMDMTIERMEHISLATGQNKFPEGPSGLASGIRHSGGGEWGGGGGGIFNSSGGGFVSTFNSFTKADTITSSRVQLKLKQWRYLKFLEKRTLKC